MEYLPPQEKTYTIRRVVQNGGKYFNRALWRSNQQQVMFCVKLLHQTNEDLRELAYTIAYSYGMPMTAEKKRNE